MADNLAERSVIIKIECPIVKSQKQAHKEAQNSQKGLLRETEEAFDCREDAGGRVGSGGGGVGL
jgi:hypothetical protein